MRINRLYTVVFFVIIFTPIYFKSQCSNLQVSSSENFNLLTETIYLESFTWQQGKGVNGNDIEFEAEYPKDFRVLITQLRKNV